MSIFELFAVAFCNALYIFGLYNATKPSNLLYGVAYQIEKRLPTFAYKPLLGCMQCMASFHGTLFIVVFTISSKQGIVLPCLLFLPFYICIVSAMVLLISEFYLYLQDVRLK